MTRILLMDVKPKQTDEDTFTFRLFQKELIKILDSSFTVTAHLKSTRVTILLVKRKGKTERSTH